MAFDPTTAREEEKKVAGTFDPNTALEDNQATVASDEVAKQKLSRFDYIANQAKLGLTDTAVLAEALIDTFVIDPFKTLGAQFGIGEAATGGIGERFTKNVQRLQKAGGQITGAKTDQKAPDVVTGIVGSGIRAASDPIGYVGAPIKALPMLGRATGLTAVGGTAEVGGIVGEQVEKGVFGTETGAGRAIGSITAAVKGAPVATAIQEAASGGANVVSQVANKYKAFKEDPAAANQAYATGAAKRLLGIIAKEQPGEKIDDIVTEFNRISGVINKDDLPLMVAMADNPAVRQQVTRLAKTNPDFRARVNAELEKLAQNIDNRADVLFGRQYAPIQGFESVSVNNAIKRRQQIDDQIANLTSRLDTGADEASIGKAISNLVSVKEKAARAEISPVYNSILEDAKKAGAKLPEEGVRNIYNFVVGNRIRDIFGKGTQLDKDVIKNFGPQQGGFFPASFDAVDSLKRRINELQRGRLTADEARRLGQLEELLTVERQKIPGNFSNRLAEADRLYYEKVGVPFSAQGIKDIDAKNYAEQVAPIIVKNGSALSQFIGAVGRESAEPIARNAVLAEAYQKSLKDGVIDSSKLRSYIRSKEPVLSQLPNVKAELDRAVIDSGILALERQRINDAVKIAEKRVADNFVTSVKDASGVAVPNYQELASRMFRDTNFFNKIKKDISDLDPASAKAVRNSIRAEIVNLARNNPDGGIAFITSPKNARVVNDVFGSGYTSALKDVLKLSDAVAKADIGKITAAIERSELDALAKVIPGLDIPFVTSTFRDRIASLPQKIVRIATRVNTAQLGDATDKAIADLLLDPNGVKALQKTAKEIDFNITNPISLKKISDRFQTLLPQYFYVGTKETTLQQPDRTATAPKEQRFVGGFVEEQ